MNSATMKKQPDMLDSVLILLFLTGIYMEVALNLSPTVPIPNIIAAAAGFTMLLRHPDWVEERQLVALLTVVFLFLFSVLCAAELSFLKKRLTGLVQLTYSLVLGYGFFIVAVRYNRDRLGRLFLLFCLFIIVGTALENYTGFRAISDTVREHVYNFGVYNADARDQLLYGRIRPKLFTSEPSAVTFAFALFSLLWYLLSTWRWKIVAYVALIAIGYFLMRGPTLLLGLILVGPCEIFQKTPRSQGAGALSQKAMLGFLSVILLALASWAVTSLYAERFNDIMQGSDPSFFYREIGPALAAFDSIANHPLTGIGLTGEDVFGDRLVQIFSQSSAFDPAWPMDGNAKSLNNYFWLHWTYLGLGWGLVMIAAMSWYLKRLGTQNALLCWIVWAVFGQASGAYVSPKPWAVLMFACVATVLRYRQTVTARQPVSSPAPSPARKAYA
jgi:hypothetical protein